MPGLRFYRDEFNSYPLGVFGLVISRGLLTPSLRAFSEMALEQITKDEHGGAYWRHTNWGHVLVE